MPTCTRCGHMTEVDFTFCPECGERRAAARTPHELRKTVTVVFCDVIGSTSLGESIDPEALRSLLAEYFAVVKAIVESHGGSVEKFVGDAVMAVFGVPAVHEDDALRAVRAAAEIRSAVDRLGLQVRIGANTGEVVTGTEERLVTGDTVNVAARLEQAAQPGSILLGDATVRRTRAYAVVEPVEPLRLKGKAKPVVAHRLLALRETPQREFATPLVGRDAELRALSAAFAQVVADRSCRLYTLVGAAGVGKSRLAAEFSQAVEARVVRGRCLSYGKGITYRPLAELLPQLGELPPDAAAAASLRSLRGGADLQPSADEIAWAARKLLEHAARDRPLVCVLEDLQWAEERFLDLVEHVAVLARDAPILLLCTSRPELLDLRPGWGSGNVAATTILLQPLDRAQSDRLLDALGGVGDELRERIAAAAEGNPLFLEEMAALIRESEDDVAVPPTIQALISARLDQLDTDERSVLERGAIEGRIFHRSAVVALDREDAAVSARLVSLVRKDLVRPEPSQLAGDDAYRFRHVLIRDVAYDALPKGLRATLHERLAAWTLERHTRLPEAEGVAGAHLEQAARYRSEIGRPDEPLAERAGELLAVAGRRARWRGDDAAARGLLGRALALLPPSRTSAALRLDLASAQATPQEAAALATEAGAAARADGDIVGEATALVVEALNRLLAGECDTDELERRARAALPLLEHEHDHAPLVHVWLALGYGVANARGRFADWAHAAEQALLHARLAGQRPEHLFSLDVALVHGPTPSDEALALLDSYLPALVPHPQPLLFRAQLLAMLGRFDEAWAEARGASDRLADLTSSAPGLATGEGGEYALAAIASLQGDHVASTRHLEGFCAFLEEHEQRSLLSTFAPLLGRELCLVGRHDEAETKAQLGRDLGDPHDVVTQALWRQVQARVESRRGRHAEAEQLARDAVETIEQTDALNYQGAALLDLAEVLRAASRDSAAAGALAGAVERYERKRNAAAAAPARAELLALTGSAGAPRSKVRP